jgi:hypothetical protein
MIEVHDYGEAEWFGGNPHAMQMYRILIDMAHVWDDLIDNDRPVDEHAINSAFLSALVYLPANPFYQTIQPSVMPMWVTVVSAYEAANKFERDKDEHGIEIAHMLRYAAGHIIAYAIHVCVGQEKAREYVPAMWKRVADERFAKYREEHLDVDTK